MLESGKIIRIKEKTMTVAFERSPMCEKCGACERAQHAMEMEIERIGNVNIGDTVTVDLPEKTLLRAALVAYGIPLVLLVGGLIAGYSLAQGLSLPGNPDLYAVVAGLMLAGCSFLVLHLTEKKRKASARYAPKVVQVDRLCQMHSEDTQQVK